jgi:hypothetical protein
MKKLKRRYYDAGGFLDPTAIAAMANQARTGIIDTLLPENEYGNQGPLASALKGGLFGYLKAKKQQGEDNWRRNYEQMIQRQNQFKRSDAIISGDPALVTGRQGAELYGSGGFLKKGYYGAVQATGGSLNPLSKNSAEVQGPSHSQGGVSLPQFGSELEGGETVQDNYVFSQRLGFAGQHRKLARAIGKVEQKPATRERINSLKRMYASVDSLKAQQEAIREQLNLQ